MSRPGRALAVALSLSLPAAARAGPALGLRAGWAGSVGEAAQSLPMSSTVSAQIPFQLDALWRFDPLAAGVYASYGPAIAGGCDAGARCSAYSLRIGAEAAWTFGGFRAELEPWAGGGIGYERTALTSERDGTALQWIYSGAELTLQGGLDFRVHRLLALGPFVLLSIGRYERVSLDTPVESASREIGGKSLHGWLEVGIRGIFDPWASRP